MMIDIYIYIYIYILKNLIRLTSETFTVRIKETNLGSKNDIVNFMKKKILITN